MRTVRLTRAGWWNDRVNGDAGTWLALTDQEAYEIVQVWRSAVYADGAPPPPEQDAPVPREEAVQKLVDLTEELELYDAPAPEAAEVPGEAELKKPWTIASKADWINWALNGDHGQRRPTGEEAAQMTKAQLMNRYGERL